MKGKDDASRKEQYAKTDGRAIPSPTGDKTTGKCGRFYQLGPNEDCGTMVNSAGITKKDLWVNIITLKWPKS